MAPFIQTRVNFSEIEGFFGKMRQRMKQPAGLRRRATAIMRRGPGSVQAQFDAQSTFTKTGGSRKWKPSQRVLRFGGRTLDDTGAYKSAWTGRGSGGTTNHRGQNFSIGVSPSAFPQVGVFQGNRTVRGVVPRRIGIGKIMLDRLAVSASQFYVKGKTSESGLVR